MNNCTSGRDVGGEATYLRKGKVDRSLKGLWRLDECWIFAKDDCQLMLRPVKASSPVYHNTKMGKHADITVRNSGGQRLAALTMFLR